MTGAAPPHRAMPPHHPAPLPPPRLAQGAGKMVRHNNQIQKEHFRKKWQDKVRTWFNQPARKQKRRIGE